jgi:hypothetical protein
MAVDASIYSQIAQPRPVNRLAQYANVAQIQGLQQQNALASMKMDEMRRASEDDQALRADLAAPGADPYNALLKRGRVKEANEFQKGQTERAHKEAETKKIDFDMAIKKAEYGASVLSTARDQASYDQARQVLAQTFGEKAIANMPPQFDPSYVQAEAAKGLTYAQRLTDERARQQQAETARHNKATEQTAAGQLAVSQGNLRLRGQELDFNKNQPRGQFIETTNGFVLADPRDPKNVQPVFGPDGKPLKGKAADRSLNETQAKANLFGTRMKEANRILNELEGKYSPLAVNAKQSAGDAPLIGGLAGAVGNAMLSTEGQQAEQAQRDFINAVLRRESGAAIASSEFENAKRQYFPQPNDDKKTLDQKRRNRELAIRGLEAEVPGGFRSTPTLTNPGNTGGATGSFDENDPLGILR